MNSRPGFFITLEGLDGCGKSTQTRKLALRLGRAGLQVVVTREPGGHPFAEKIRRLLLARHGQGPGPEAELLLFLAARAQHVADVILPALRKGKIVVCERFADSTFAYQAGGRGLPAGFVRAGCRFAAQGLRPDLTFWLDIPPRVGLRRAFQAKQKHDRMEDQPAAFVRRVRRAYAGLAGREPGRVRRIAANQKVEQVSNQIWQLVTNRMSRFQAGKHGL